MLRATLASIAVIAIALFGFGSELSHATSRDNDGDTQSAKRSLLTLHDFPAGWDQAKRPDMEVFCPAYTKARHDASGVGSSPQFAKGSFLEAASSVYRYADEAAAKRAFRAIASRATQRCYVDETTKTLKSGGASEVRKVRVRQLSIQPLGDQRAGTRFVFPITAAAVELDVTVDLTYVRSGRTLSLVFCLGAGDTFDRRLRGHLIATQFRRLAA